MASTINLKTNSAQLKCLVCIVVLVALMFVKAEAGVKAYIIVTAWGILMWMFELLPNFIVGLLLPVLYVVLGAANAQTAFSGWLSSTPWTTIGGLMLGTAFVSSGLVKRIAYKILLLTGGSFRSVIISTALTCIIITPAIPSVMAKVALITPIAIGLCDVLGAEKKSKTASALMLAVFYALWSPKMAFLTASADSILAADIIGSTTGVSITWFGWAKDMFIPAILWTVLSVSLVFLIKPDKVKVDKAYVREKYEELGSFSQKEKRVAALGVLLLILLATDSVHNVDAAWIMMFAGCLCFVPQIGVLEAKDFSKIPFSIVFFLVGAVSIGTVTKSLGIADVVVGYFAEVLKNCSPLMLVLGIYLFSFACVFILNPLALSGTLMGAVSEVCMSLGYPAVIGGYAMIMGFNQAILPYQIAPLMFIYGSGYIKMSHLTKVMAVRLLVGIVFMAAITYPYWKMRGLV